MPTHVWHTVHDLRPEAQTASWVAPAGQPQTARLAGIYNANRAVDAAPTLSSEHSIRPLDPLEGQRVSNAKPLRTQHRHSL